MASLVIVFVALTAVIGSSNKVGGSTVQTLDLSNILELVKPHRLNVGPSKARTQQVQVTSSDSSDSSSDSDESDDSDNTPLARFRKDRIVDLLEIGTKDQMNKNRLRYSRTKKNYGITEKSDDAENKRLAKERIIDLIDAAAKKKSYTNRLMYSKDNKNYGQTALKADDSNNKRLESERIINLIERAAKVNTYNNRLTYSKDKKNYGQTALKSDDSDNKRLESESILDLIEAVAKTEDNRNGRVTNRKEKPNYGQTSYLVNSENSDNTLSINNHVQKQILEKLFSQFSNGEERQKKPKKRLVPNRLTPTVTINDVKKYYAKQHKNIEDSKDQEVTGLEDYSKIYIVLNPEAVQKSKNKNSLNDLIAKVLALSSPTSQRESEGNGRPRRYKGFVVNDNSPIRRFKTIGDAEKLGDYEKKVDHVAVPLGEITAMPT